MRGCTGVREQEGALGRLEAREGAGEAQTAALSPGLAGHVKSAVLASLLALLAPLLW